MQTESQLLCLKQNLCCTFPIYSFFFSSFWPLSFIILHCHTLRSIVVVHLWLMMILLSSAHRKNTYIMHVENKKKKTKKRQSHNKILKQHINSNNNYYYILFSLLLYIPHCYLLLHSTIRYIYTYTHTHTTLLWIQLRIEIIENDI